MDITEKVDNLLPTFDITKYPKTKVEGNPHLFTDLANSKASEDKV